WHRFALACACFQSLACGRREYGPVYPLLTSALVPMALLALLVQLAEGWLVVWLCAVALCALPCWPLCCCCYWIVETAVVTCACVCDPRPGRRQAAVVAAAAVSPPGRSLFFLAALFCHTVAWAPSARAL